ncbi:uncharacterized protein LOC135195560 [Macrobrachium nipponense]|uniref:uncharacterized protein LOC135195560 n=1 Tax=Macrobrachium nipponense TaxID=159736 RepID=UPI0030C8C43E
MNLKDLDVDANNKSLQRSHGLSWDLNTYYFMFQLSFENKPITHRGILSTINSTYDLLGILAPIIIYEKLVLRSLVSETVDWDHLISDELALEARRIPRTYVPYLGRTTTRELHVFSNGSKKTIPVVVYLCTTDSNRTPHLRIVLGMAKFAPTSGHTIPVLELCAAVLGVNIAQCVIDQVDIHIDNVKYYMDSKIVLGYIFHETRRVFIYVANRVARIRKFSNPSQWGYVPIDHNPADLGTRSVLTKDLQDSIWLFGPQQFLASNCKKSCNQGHQLVDPDEDYEIRPTVTVLKTCAPSESVLETHRFERFSNWKRLVKAIAFLKRLTHACRSKKLLTNAITIDDCLDTEHFITRSVQATAFREEKNRILQQNAISKRSCIANLNPFLDEPAIMSVGGHISNSDLCLQEKKPIIILGRHHVATLLLRHYHDKMKHQGRHFTEGAITSAGLWITGAKQLISSVIHRCVTLEVSPPFTNVGVDTFGLWNIVIT